MATSSDKTPIRKLDRDSFPMRLWKKSNRHGVWNSDDIDFQRDRQDWLALPKCKREHVLQLCAFFQAGEQSVTLELLPLMRLVASEGRLEEEIYLTSFLYEEAKHVEFFSSFLSTVCEETRDLSSYLNPSYKRIVCDELSDSLRRLDHDQSPEAQVRAAGTYHMVVEGMLAEGGYYLFDRMLVESQIFPGMQKAITFLRADESRHIAFGVYLLTRLIDEHGERAYRAFLDRMSELAPLIKNSTREFMNFFGREHAFGVNYEELELFSSQRFNTRMRRILSAHERKSAK